MAKHFAPKNIAVVSVTDSQDVALPQSPTGGAQDAGLEVTTWAVALPPGTGGIAVVATAAEVLDRSESTSNCAAVNIAQVTLTNGSCKRASHGVDRTRRLGGKHTAAALGATSTG